MAIDSGHLAIVEGKLNPHISVSSPALGLSFLLHRRSAPVAVLFSTHLDVCPLLPHQTVFSNAQRTCPISRPFLTELKYRIEYGAFRVLAALARALPLEVGADISAACWRLFAPRLKRHKRTLAHIALAFPDMPEAERERIARAMWDNLGRVLIESFHLDELTTGDRITFADPNWRETYSLPNDSGVVCAPHLGNWEVAVIAANRLGMTPGGIYQRIKNPYVDAYVTKMREPLYPGGLYVKGGGGARALLRHAKNGGTVALLADLHEMRDISVPFFGHSAPSTSFPAVVARTQNLPILVGAAIRCGKSRFKFELEHVPVTQTDDKDADIVATTAAIQAVFERMIRKYPEQWMWSHRRWR